MICEKIQYTSKQNAEQAVVGLQKARRGKNISKNQPVSVYRCVDCGSWHMTSHRGGKNKKKKGLVHTHTTTIKTTKGPKKTDIVLRIQNFNRH